MVFFQLIKVALEKSRAAVEIQNVSLAPPSLTGGDSNRGLQEEMLHLRAEIHQHSKAVFPLFSDVSPPYTCDEMCGVHLVFRTRTLLGGEMGSLDP